MDSGGKYSFVNMTKSSIGNPQEVDQALLDEFWIQEDVRIYRQLPGYDDFGVSIYQTKLIWTRPRSGL